MGIAILRPKVRTEILFTLNVTLVSPRRNTKLYTEKSVIRERRLVIEDFENFLHEPNSLSTVCNAFY